MPERHDFWHEPTQIAQPACGDQEKHMFHSHQWIDSNFKVHSTWCDGVCNCKCSCPDHQGKPHGPGAHK